MICKGVMNQILSHKLALNANFIIIHDKAQLAPVMPGNENWEEPEDRYFTNGREYKKRNWHQIHLTKQMQQNDPKFIETLDNMRIFHDQKDGGLREMIALMKDRIISERDALSLYRYDFQDLLIASTNEEVDRWNKMLLKQSGPGQLKVKYTKTNRTHVNNERVILQTEKEQNQELAFASTVHIVQGLTFPDRLFISLSLLEKRNNFDNHLLYTAVSRVKSLDQLYLVAV
jgi:ATP-dependent exoDNAse (exonuclease V) alpha subunit